MLRAAVLAVRRSGGMATGALGGWPGLNSVSAVLQFGNPTSKMAGLAGAILGAGNPLLDLSAVVDQALLDKYGVSAWEAWPHCQRRAAFPIRAADGVASPPSLRCS